MTYRLGYYQYLMKEKGRELATRVREEIKASAGGNKTIKKTENYVKEVRIDYDNFTKISYYRLTV